ncbi:hypothetical protein P4O66_006932, partial [Electrophorus voltai]
MRHINTSLDSLLFTYHPNCSSDDATTTTHHLAHPHLYKMDTHVRTLFIDFGLAFNTITPQNLIVKLTLPGLNTSLCNRILDLLAGKTPESPHHVLQRDDRKYPEKLWQHPAGNRQVFMGLGQVFMGLGRVFMGLGRVFMGLERVFMGLERVFMGLRWVFMGVGQVFMGVGRVFMGLERVFMGLERVFMGLGRVFMGLGWVFMGLGQVFMGL